MKNLHNFKISCTQMSYRQFAHRYGFDDSDSSSNSSDADSSDDESSDDGDDDDDGDAGLSQMIGSMGLGRDRAHYRGQLYTVLREGIASGELRIHDVLMACSGILSQEFGRAMSVQEMLALYHVVPKISELMEHPAALSICTRIGLAHPYSTAAMTMQLPTFKRNLSELIMQGQFHQIRFVIKPTPDTGTDILSAAYVPGGINVPAILNICTVQIKDVSTTTQAKICKALDKLRLMQEDLCKALEPCASQARINAPLVISFHSHLVLVGDHVIPDVPRGFRSASGLPVRIYQGREALDYVFNGDRRQIALFERQIRNKD
jgi:hypothetical protein